MKTLTLVAPVAIALLLGCPSVAAPETQAENNIYNYLQVLRSEFNPAKVEVVNRIMKLSEEDAKKFWPIYHDYENELGKLAITRTELTAEFVKAHQDGTFDNAKAKDMAKRWFAGQRARLDLLEKYHQKIQETLSSVQAGQFLQIENQIGLFIDVAIASEMPLVGQQQKDEK